MKQTLSRASGRIIGLDVARGLAVIGMFIAHVGAATEGTTGEFLQNIADGRSSILFAVLAGVSLAIMSGRQTPYAGPDLLAAKTRIVTRAACLVVISGILSLMNEIVALILIYYAVWFILALPFLRWRPRNLFIAAATLGVLGPIVFYYGVAIMEKAGMVVWGGEANLIVTVVLNGVYPGIVYMAYVLAGLGIGRLALTSWRTQATIATVGAALTLIFYGASKILTASLPEQAGDISTWTKESWEPSQGFHWDPTFPWPDMHQFLSFEPHSNTIFEVFGSGGFALAVIGLLLLGGRILGKILFPLAAVGSMSLTAYSIHIIAIWNSEALIKMENNHALLWLIGATLVFATVWRLLIGRGPLETILYRASHRAVRSLWKLAYPSGRPDPAPVAITAASETLDADSSVPRAEDQLRGTETVG